MRKKFLILVLVLYASSLLADNKSWWREARFGMFIHWGLYAIPAGEWSGEAKYAEWIRDRAEIPIDTYHQFVSEFNPTAFDPDQWVKMAKQAGMKYIVLTSKHHDGFCLYDSKLTEFDIMSTPYGRDILRQISEAAAREGLRVGWYYSIMDWNHPDYLPRRPWEVAKRPAGDADMKRYIDYMKGQLKEIITNYRDVEIIWFDGGWEKTWTSEYGEDLIAYVRSLKPTIIVNNRASKSPEGIPGEIADSEYGGDFGTPEQEIPDTGLPGVDWETCMTLNDHWGFKKNDFNWKSARMIIHYLADIASKGGNFLLNVGPTARGVIPEASITRLDSLGKWMAVNSEAIYGTQASPFEDLDWGRCTRKSIYSGTRLYLHVFDWPQDGRLIVPGILNKPVQAYLLSDPERILESKRYEDAILISVPDKPQDTINSVVVLDIDGNPDVVKAPQITVSAPIFLEEARISIRADMNSMIRYNLDDRPPSLASPLYQKPIVVKETTRFSARSFRDNHPVSKTAGTTVTKVNPNPAKQHANLKQGLTYRYYEGVWDEVPEFDNLKVLKTGRAAIINTSPKLKEKYFGLEFEGYIKIPETAVYIISIGSNDGSLLYIDGQLVVNNDEDHPYKEEQSHIALQEGMHAIRVSYFQEGGGADLKVFITGPDMEKQEIPAEMYWAE